MVAKARCTKVASHGRFDRNTQKPRRAAVLLSLNGRAHEGHDERADPQIHRLHDRSTHQGTNAVEVYPPDIVKRRTVAWDGMAAEIVQATRPEKIEFRFRAPLHLLAVYDRGIRSDGETFVDGLPRSKLRAVRRKLTLLPALCISTLIPPRCPRIMKQTSCLRLWRRGFSSTMRHCRRLRSSSGG